LALQSPASNQVKRFIHLGEFVEFKSGFFTNRTALIVNASLFFVICFPALPQQAADTSLVYFSIVYKRCSVVLMLTTLTLFI